MLSQSFSNSGTSMNATVSRSAVSEFMRIAMASHGRTGAARVFYGSVASGVLHRVDRPVLIIRSRRD